MTPDPRPPQARPAAPSTADADPSGARRAVDRRPRRAHRAGARDPADVGVAARFPPPPPPGERPPPVRRARRRPGPAGGPPPGRPAPASRWRSPAWPADPGLRAPGRRERRRSSRRCGALHPGLQPQRLRKSTLLAMSWAIEDECCARAERPMIFGGVPEGALLPRGRGALDRAGPGGPLHDGLRRLPRGARRPVGRDDLRATCPTTPRCAGSGRWSATPRTTPRCSPPGSCPASPTVPDREAAVRVDLDRRAAPPYATPPGRAPRWPSSSATPRRRRCSTSWPTTRRPRRPSCCRPTSLLNRVVAYVDRT